MKSTISERYNENSTTKEFLDFLQKVRDEKLFKGTQWGFTDGFSNIYESFGYFLQKVIKQIREKEDTDSPITNYFIWQIQANGVDKTEIDNALKDGLSGILELGRDNKDITFEKIVTSFKSKSQEEFGKFMGSGSGGSLDENLELNENEIAALGNELADLIKKEVGEEEGELKEFVDPISILSTVLASTTLVNILAKYVGKLFKKYGFEKGEKGAKMIYDFTHKLENDFKSPIKRIVKLFTKDEKTIGIITDSLYAVLILSLGLKAGGGAIQSMDKGNLATGSIKTLKAALKGKDLANLLKTIAKAAV